MDQGTSIKIRTLPRAAEAHPVEQPASETSWLSQRLLVNLGIVACCAVMTFMIMSKPQSKQGKPAPANSQSKDLTSVKAPGAPNDIVAKYLQESQIKTEMLARARQLENINSRGDTSDAPAFQEDDRRNYGIQFDQEESSSRVFEDLHDNDAIPQELLPGDRINARLAKNKWTNELERNERITFVREFIKSAYAKGYEVQLDQNLVVVGVRKITNQKVNIDQVLSRLAKQGM